MAMLSDRFSIFTATVLECHSACACTKIKQVHAGSTVHETWQHLWTAFRRTQHLKFKCPTPCLLFSACLHANMHL